MTDQFTLTRCKQQLSFFRERLESLPIIEERYPTEKDIDKSMESLVVFQNAIEAEKQRARTIPSDVIGFEYIPALDEILVFLDHCKTDKTLDKLISHVQDAVISIDWMLDQLT